MSAITTTTTGTTRAMALDGPAATARQQPTGRASPSNRRLLNDDEFRVGSYVVHTPPSLSVGNRISLHQSGIGRGSNIPGYQFKTKIANLTLESPSHRRLEQNGVLASSAASPTAEARSMRHQHPSLLTGKSISVYSSPPEAPPSPIQAERAYHNQQPQAIPRLLAKTPKLNQEQATSSNNNNNNNNMGDSLSTPVVAQQYPLAPAKAVASPLSTPTRTSGKTTNHEAMINNMSYEGGGDCWTTPDDGGEAAQTPTKQGLNSKYHYIRRGQAVSENHHHHHHHHHHHNHNQTGNNRYQTPRLPRGVSKIPHPQVVSSSTNPAAHDQANGGDNQQPQVDSAVNAGGVNNNNMDRYLTFSKDQATSHFKTLREELVGLQQATPTLATDRIDQGKHTDSEPPPPSQQEKTATSNLKLLATSPTSTPKTNKPVPSERHLKSAEIVVPVDNRDNLFQPPPVVPSMAAAAATPTTTPSMVTHYHRQQPICEAFIMTGDSIVKKSCTESENNNNNSTTTVAAVATQKKIFDTGDSGQKQQEAKTVQLVAESQLMKCDEEMENLESQQQKEKIVASEVSKQDLDNNNSNSSSTPPMPNSSSFDRDSARRLAKRLYNLSGFKRSDVCHHLVKNNPFSQMVAEEYVNLFDFRSMKLDAALRKFLSKLQLKGETQERERMLSQFSQRYYDCNKEKFPNADTVQTLVCALILLNTDLHGGHSKKNRSKLSLGAFIDGLNSSVAALSQQQCNNGSLHSSPSIGYTFPRHLLIDLYESIKKRPLKSSDDKCDMTSLEAELDKIYSQQVGGGGGGVNSGARSNTLPARRFAPGSNAPSSTLNATARRQLKFGLGKMNGNSSSGNFEFDAENAIQFKSGYLNRKRVFEANGKATSKGSRGWRRVYVILQDLRMFMQLGIHDESKQLHQQQQEEQTAKTRAQAIAQSMKNSVKIHHTFAKRSTSYTKRDFVFHLRLADQSEFLLQANNEQDMQSWIDTINFATACLSSPALPSAVSNSPNKQQNHHQLRTQKPLLPVAYTKLSYWEQLIDHEDRLQRLRVELDEHLSEAPNTRSAKKKFKTEFIEKIAYLKQEIERYTVYVDLMRSKSNSAEAIVLSKHPYIASLTPSDEMIKSLPSFAPPPQRTTPKAQSPPNSPV